MPSSTFKSKIDITHIGTATTLIQIDGVTFLTDPAFDPAGSSYQFGSLTLKNHVGLALSVSQLPPVHAILLSHEDHPDNLDTSGRALLPGHKVFTTADGANNLRELDQVTGFRPWESVTSTIGGKEFKITATPCVHLEGGEVVGFILENDAFGIDEASGLPNVIWIGGDTNDFPELDRIKDKWHVVVGVFNLGVANPMGVPITMGGHECAGLCRRLGVEIIVPAHFDGWDHFTEKGDALKTALGDEGIMEKVSWLKLGESVRII